MEFLEIWFQGFLISMIPLTLLWIISVMIKNASIIDPFWGFGFIILAAFYLYSSPNYTSRHFLVFILVVIWGIRLTAYLFWRNKGHEEDYRYQQFRKDYGEKRYWWFSFFQVFLLQGALMSIVALPLLGIFLNSSNKLLAPVDFIIGSIWLIGMAFEAGGDFQLASFKMKEENKGKVLNTGFWKYTRHPNYFGDAVIWWAFGFFAIASGSYITVIGPVLMNILLLKVSGVSMLERTLKSTKPAYEEYINRTNAFLPWFPKKKDK